MIINGFCLKCKTYGIMSNVQMITMKNGRTRASGYCMEKDCNGRISKIIS
ncbi:MAG: DUF5679 domain-containing protein [Candidatus Poseidoniales archaeon]